MRHAWRLESSLGNRIRGRSSARLNVEGEGDQQHGRRRVSGSRQAIELPC